jgi:hypothetical protein
MEGHRLLLGGGGGGGTQSTSTNVNYSPEEAARRSQVMDESQRIYNATAGDMGAYPGASVAGVSGATQEAQRMAVDASREGQQQVKNINAGVNYGLTGAMDVKNNPYLQDAITAATRPIRQEYTDAGGVMSSIRTDAGNAGQTGSSRQGIAEGLAAGRMAQAEGDAAAKIGSDAYNTGQQTFQKTLAFAPQAMEASMTPVNQMSSVGAQQENYQQQLLDYQANARVYGQNAPWIPLQNYASIVYGGSAPSTSAVSTGTGAGRNAIGQVAGAGLTAASMYQMMNA